MLHQTDHNFIIYSENIVTLSNKAPIKKYIYISTVYSLTSFHLFDFGNHG